jgi:hypothetical protein
MPKLRIVQLPNAGYHRRNFLVPVPSFDFFRELNDYLQERCISELARTLRGHELTKAERL